MAGVVALMLAKDPRQPAAELKQRLLQLSTRGALRGVPMATQNVMLNMSFLLE